MQSKNQSRGCCATPLQPFSCQMRRQHLRCCQPKSNASSVPHTQSATYRCIVNLASPRLFCYSLCLLFSSLLFSTAFFLCPLMRRFVGSSDHTFTDFNFDFDFQFRFRLSFSIPLPNGGLRAPFGWPTKAQLKRVSSASRAKSAIG